MESNQYPVAMRIMHWLMALLVIGMLAFGLLLEELPKDFQWRNTLYDLHKSFGVVVFILLAVRVVIRFSSSVPALPVAISAIEQKMAHLGHWILYALLLLIPLSGFLMSSASPQRFGVKLFGWRLPDLPASKFWANVGYETHGLFAWALIAVLAIHIAGVIKHRFFDKSGADVLPRMWRKR